MREIGSEFYAYDTQRKDGSNAVKKFSFALSGRTSLDHIIKDILENNRIDYAYLPSYCCDSMIVPFVENGIKVVFYDIDFDDTSKISLQPLKAREGTKAILFALDYFGFDKGICEHIFSLSNASCVVKIEDMTHSFFSKRVCNDVDYYFSSIRKWTCISGLAVYEKLKGNFSFKLEKDNRLFLLERKKAMDLKQRYMQGEDIDKKNFLDLFKSAEHLLDEDYSGYRASCEDIDFYQKIDFRQIKKKRRKNAESLMKYLKMIEWIELPFMDLKKEDCPLCIPILVNPRLRDDLRNFLINNGVFCPVHWPLTKWHNGISQESERIYRSEISLICDQRYNNEDMRYIAHCIKKFARCQGI